MNNNSTARDSARIKFESARSNLLLMIILTAVNVVMLLMGGESMLLFSATLPYLIVVVGTVTQIQIMLIISVCFAAAILLIYLLCWGMSKRHHGWMIAALVLFVIDTAAMAYMYISSGDFSGIIDVFMHAWVLYYLAVGIKYGKQLKNMPEEAIETTDYVEYRENEQEDDSSQSPYGAETGELQESIPLCCADEEVKHRVLLEADALGRHICYRRVKKTNELVINGWVYAQYEALFEEPHTLEAMMEGHLIEVGLDNRAISFITVDGKRIAQKRRLV